MSEVLLKSVEGVGYMGRIQEDTGVRVEEEGPEDRGSVGLEEDGEPGGPGARVQLLGRLDITKGYIKSIVSPQESSCRRRRAAQTLGFRWASKWGGGGE